MQTYLEARYCSTWEHFHFIDSLMGFKCKEYFRNCSVLLDIKTWQISS